MFFIFILCLGSCGKNHNYPDLPIIGHAITGLYNPQRIYKDNSKEAFEYALLYSDLAGIEVDVQLSKDGNLWLYHDTDLSSQTDFSGAIGSRLDSELEKISYSTFHQEKLARLDEIIFPSNRLDLILYIDLKDFSYREMDTLIAEQVINSLKLFQNKNPNFTNFNIILSNLAYSNLFYENGYIAIYSDIVDFQDGLNNKEEFGLLKGVFIKNKSVTKEEVDQLKANDLKVILFEINSVASIREAKLKFPDELLPVDFLKALKEK